MSLNRQIFTAVDQAVEALDSLVDTLDVMLQACAATDLDRIQHILDRVQWLREELLILGLDATDPPLDAHLEAAYEDRYCIALD